MIGFAFLALAGDGVVRRPLVGLQVARRMNQRVFDRVVIALTIVGAVYLLI